MCAVTDLRSGVVTPMVEVGERSMLVICCRTLSFVSKGSREEIVNWVRLRGVSARDERSCKRNRKGRSFPATMYLNSDTKRAQASLEVNPSSTMLALSRVGVMYTMSLDDMLW